ncbi:uncharacterized protein TNCV_190541 [Trichonephila clavipes]|nr:uncharacterized protein TNCV_190541 [Trichonephila clavipes]
MDWPARSPDLNPIEHVWDFLGRRLVARTLPPVTIRELRLALQDEWAAMPQQLIDTLILSMRRRCETCLAAISPHTITPAVGAVCRCKAKEGLRRSPRGLHTRTRLSSLLRLNLDSRASLKITWFHSTAVHFPRAWQHSKWRHRWVGVKGSTRNGCQDPKCHSTTRLRIVREDTGAPNESTTCAWLVADEAFGCTRAFLTMWRSSRRLVCREHPEPGLHVNDISRIHWPQYLLKTHSERQN